MSDTIYLLGMKAAYRNLYATARKSKSFGRFELVDRKDDSEPLGCIWEEGGKWLSAIFIEDQLRGPVAVKDSPADAGYVVLQMWSAAGASQEARQRFVETFHRFDLLRSEHGKIVKAMSSDLPSNGSAAEIAAALARRVFQASIDARGSVQAQLGPSTEGWRPAPDQYWEIVSEFQYLLLNLIDRIAFNVLSSPNREAVMDHLAGALLDQTVAHAAAQLKGLSAPLDPRTFGPNERALRSALYSQLKERASLYGSCRSVSSSKEESPAGTVLWEFQKALGERLGYGYDMVVGLLFTMCATSALRQVDPAATLARVSNSPS